MLLQKITVALVTAALLTVVASNASFDFENYVSYALDPQAALERFSAEPIFPLFILSSYLLGLAPDVAVHLFIFVASYILTHAIAMLACEDRRWSFTRTAVTIAISLPFILFTLVVPRQGFATGPLLIALWIIRRKHRLITPQTLILVFVSFLAHAPTAVAGSALIFLGHARIRYIILIFSIGIIALLMLKSVEPDIFNNGNMAYSHYGSNLRETGRVRMLFFVLISFSYILLYSRQTGGFVGVTPVRSILVVCLFLVGSLGAYTFFATDSVRLTYFLGIMMLIEISRRFIFLRRSRRENAVRQGGLP